MNKHLNTNTRKHTLHLLPYVLVESGIRVAAFPGQMGVSGGGGGGSLINTSLTKHGCLSSFLFRPRSGLGAFKGSWHRPSPPLPTRISQRQCTLRAYCRAPFPLLQQPEGRLLPKPVHSLHCCLLNKWKWILGNVGRLNSSVFIVLSGLRPEMSWLKSLDLKRLMSARESVPSGGWGWRVIGNIWICHE